MNQFIQSVSEKIFKGVLLSRQEAIALNEESKKSFDDLLYFSNVITKHFFGNQVRVCSIVPGRLGGCSQDCRFCAQSIRYKTKIEDTTVLTDEQILAGAKEAKEKGVSNFGIVYSGKAITEDEIQRMERMAIKIKNEYGLEICGSFGIIDREIAERLSKAGFTRYNHNLETSENYFPEIVTTHDYSDRVNTIRTAIEAGLKVCGGGIFGVGESETDRIEMAFELRDLGVDIVPMNFLHPIEGTPLQDMKPLRPKDILRIIALYRFIMPTTHLKVAGGRVLNLRDMQSWIFNAGCTSIISGNYLTTAGRSVDEDMRMLEDLELEPC